MDQPDNNNFDLSAMEYWKAVKTPTVKQLCDECGTTFDYFKHIANLRKRPSVDLARRMVACSKKLTPQFALSLDKLLVPRDAMRTHSAPRECERANR